MLIAWCHLTKKYDLALFVFMIWNMDRAQYAVIIFFFPSLGKPRCLRRPTTLSFKSFFFIDEVSNVHPDCFCVNYSTVYIYLYAHILAQCFRLDTQSKPKLLICHS